jgi:probable F420-dependent oxidoreductase
MWEDTMRIGVSFPHQALGVDPVAIRDWAQAADELGIDRLIVYEHVILPDPARHPGQTFRYTNQTNLHEPLVLCGFLGAVTRRVGLQTGILILPLRDTIIVAKQAAEVDVLSGGRLRLGVGIGWEAFEFAAIGRDFHERGARLDEQLPLLRALWSDPSVDFQGRWHRVEGAGICPLPVQRPIPLWVAGGVRAALRRAARHGDGWIAPGDYLVRAPDEEARRLLGWLHEEAAAAGRAPASLGVQGVITIGRQPEAEWTARAEAWRQLGATDLLVDTGVSARASDPGLTDPAQQIQALRRISMALVSGEGRPDA